ncbi:MAG: response regulator, partial [Rubricoccaceae bacterium]|nr:response regulator [Rubricoccaceae bacterium]
VAQAIMADSELSSTHLIILTSMGCDNFFAGETDEGQVAFLTKPVRRNDLYNQMGILVSGVADSSPDEIVSMGAPQEAQGSEQAIDASILLAEDNPVNQEVMIAQLEALGCRVELAMTGMEVLAAVKRSSYDVILMDCQMPDMDGLEATTVLRRSERENNAERRVPIIAVTANVVAGEQERCLEAGMDDYLCKPLKQSQLLEKLEYWLSGENDRTEDAAGGRREVA